MANLQNVQIKILNGVVQPGAAVSYDLSCGSPEVAKRLSQVNVLIVGATFIELPYPTTGSVLLTKIFNCDDTYDYAIDDICDLQLLLIDSVCEPSQLGSSPSNPIYTSGGGAAPIITTDIEYIENESTGFLDKIIHTWIDGVAQPEVITPTLYTLSTKPNDVEVNTVCNTITGFYDIIERTYNSDGTLLSQTITATAIGCLEAAPVVTIIQRQHNNYLVTGTAPLVIPAGAISISIRKTNATGIVNISGDNATDFPLTVNNEVFTDGVTDGVSTLSAYTITGTAAGTTYKVHIIR